MTGDFQAEFELYRKMESQAISLRDRSLEYFVNSDYENAEKAGIQYLEIIQNLPRGPIHTSYKSRFEKSDSDSDMVVCTAYILQMLVSVYQLKERALEALACLQKLHYIISNYRAYTYDYSQTESFLKQQIETWAKAYSFVDNDFQINETLVKKMYPKVNSANFDRIKNYNPYLLQKRIASGSTSSSSSSSDGCFIATAAYSTSTHPDLDTFRNFRDEKLLTHSVGKRLVSVYYQISPTIAQYVEKLPILKNFLKRQLGHLAQWMRTQGVTSK